MSQMQEEPQKARTKLKYRDVFIAAHRAIKRYHQGGAEVARMINVTPGMFLNQMNPGDFEHAPSLITFLDTLDYLQSREMADSIASLANCCTVPTRANLKPMPATPDTVAELVGATIAGQLALNEYITRRGVAQTTAVREAMFELIDIAHAVILATQTPRPFNTTPMAVADEETGPRLDATEGAPRVTGPTPTQSHTGTDDRDISPGYR